MAKWNSQSTSTDLAAFSDDPQVKRQLRRRRIIIFVVIAIIVAAVGLSVKPAYQAFRNIQINRNLAAAETAARVEDWGTARNKARSVLLARPTEFEAFRIWHKALSNLGEPRAYLIAASLFMDPRASREDRLDALGVLARQAPEAVALSAYASLEESMQQEPAALAAMSPLLTRRGETAMVEKVLRQSSVINTDPTLRLELLRALCGTPTSERVAEARQIFAGLVADDASEPALEALLILGETPGGLAKGSPLPPLPVWVQAQPKATTTHHLYALHPAIDEAGDAADDLYQIAIDRFIELDPGVLGSWLTRHGKSARAADLLTEAAKTSPTAYIARLNALLREKRTADIKSLLNEPPEACDLVDLELAKAAAARMMGDPAAETNAWNRAMQNAAFDDSRNRFLEINRYATLADAQSIIIDSWVAAIRIGWGPIPLYSDLQPVFASLASLGRSEDLLAISRTLLRFEPWNAELSNNYQYLALIHEVTPPAVSAATMEEFVEKHPDQPEFRSALALAWLLADESEKALAQIPLLKQSNLVSPLMIRALEGTALVLSGQTDSGRTLLEGIDWGAFMPAESLAFRRILTRLELKDLPLPEMNQLPPVEDPDMVPAWRRAIERMEKDRATDTLPAFTKPDDLGTGNAD